MEKNETLSAFYRDKFNRNISQLDQEDTQFDIFRFDDCLDSSSIKYRRRDFYKVTFLQGNSVIHYSDKSLELKGASLCFFSPDIPYTVDMHDGRLTGKYFIFKEGYLNEYFRRNIKDLPLFANGLKPAYMLNKSQIKAVTGLFNKIQSEWESNYAYKDDLIRNRILELMHLAVKMEPVQSSYHLVDANARITAVFTELLDKQFPVDPKHHRIELRTAKEYAEKLYVHVNHLNHALKLTTGKSTTNHLLQRIANEAKILLKYSDYDISEISYSLGFDDPTHFNHFFKKQTGQIPSSFRI